MSAPLVVNTKDGVCWTRRSVTASGLALYAPEGVCKCPEFVMATLAELAEHGIVGSADVLPVPSGPVQQVPEGLEVEVTGDGWGGLQLWLRHARGGSYVGRYPLSGKRGKDPSGNLGWQRLDERDAAEIRALLDSVFPTAQDDETAGLRAHAEFLMRDVKRLRTRVAELEARIEAEECRCPEPAPLCQGCHCRCHAKQADASADRLTRLLAPCEDPHDGPLAHTYRVGRDLPQTGGV